MDNMANDGCDIEGAKFLAVSLRSALTVLHRYEEKLRNMFSLLSGCDFAPRLSSSMYQTCSSVYYRRG